MAEPKTSDVSPQEYLARERVAEIKSEYFAGEMFAMSGGTRAHSLICVNLIREASGRLGESSGCEVHTSDLRVKSAATGLYTYPDVMVVCSKLKFLERRADTLVNPLLIIEVLSKSTRDYDRGAKFEFYKGIDTLQEYVLVESESPRVECYHRGAGNQWIIETWAGLDALARLESLGYDLPLRQVYHKVSWTE